MTNNHKPRYPHLGKVSVAILEHLVKPVLGDEAIKELKKPVLTREERESVKKSLAEAEKRFTTKYDNKELRDAVLNLPLADSPSVGNAVWDFYNRPTDPALAKILRIQLITEFPQFSREQVDKAVSAYLNLVKQELGNVSQEIRDKLQTLALLAIREDTARMAAGVEQLVDLQIQQVSFTRRPYRSEIASFLAHYAETFVGREQLEADVAGFAGQLEPGYLLIEAQPGFGKTALMAHLILRYENNNWAQTPRPHLLYFFIRWPGENTAEVFLRSLNAQLLDYLGLRGGVLDNLAALRDQFSNLWSLSLARASDKEPLLLLVDGLDEMASADSSNDKAIAEVLPENLGAFAHVIVTSRPNPDALQLPPYRHPLTKAKVWVLETFGEKELMDLLRHNGVSQADSENLASRILKLTKGEPLFARFICQDVAEKGEEALAQLEENPPDGVKDYFRRQLDRLSTVKRDLTWDVLGLLLVALGGLKREEIADILGEKLRRVDQAIEPIQRFFLGKSRLTLIHSQFREVVREDIAKKHISLREQEEYRQKLLGWCQRYEKQGWPDNTPDYVLDHYAAHLHAAHQKDALYTLINKRWRELKFKRTLSHRSFAKDVSLAIKAARDQEPPDFVPLVRHCLLYAYLGSLANSLPPEALGVLARIDHLDVARDWTALIPDPVKQSKAYRYIGTALLAQANQKEAGDVFKQALVVIEEIPNLQARADELREIAPALAKLNDGYSLKQALNLAIELTKKPQDDIETLRQVVDALAGIQSQESLTQALSLVATTIEDERLRAQALVLVVEAMALIGEQAGLEAELSQAIALTDGKAQSILLQGLAQAFAHLNHRRALWQVYLVAKTITDPADLVEEQIWTQVGISLFSKNTDIDPGTAEPVGNESSAKALKSVATAFAHIGAFDQAITVIDEIEVNRIKEAALGEIAVELATLNQTDEALLRAKDIEEPKIKATTLSQISQKMAQKGEFVRALDIAESIEKPKAQIDAFLTVAEGLLKAGDTDGAVNLTRRAMEMTAEVFGRSYDEEKERCFQQAILILTQAGKLSQALALVEAKQFSGVNGKATVIGEMAEILAKSEDKGSLSRILASVRTIFDEEDRAKAIEHVARTMAQISDLSGLNQALEAAWFNSHLSWRHEARKAVIAALATAGAVEQAMREAETISIWWEKAETFSRIGQVLAMAGDKQRAKDAIEQAFLALIIYRRSSYEACRISVLAQALSKVGTYEHLKTLLEVAAAIDLDSAKAHALSGMAAAFWRAGDSASLRQVLDATIGMQDLTDLAMALSNIALAMGRLEDREGLYRILSKAEKLPDEPRRRASVLGNVARALAHLDDKDGIEKIASLIGELRDKESRDTVLSGIACAYTQVGDLEQAVAAVQQIEDWLYKAPTLINMASILVSKKAGDELDQLWQAGLDEVLGKFLNPSDDAWLDVLSALMLAGQDEKVDEFINQAWVDTKDVNKRYMNKLYKVAILGNIALLLIQMGKSEAATQAIDQALATAETIESGKDKVSALTGLSQKLHWVGLTNKVSHPVNQALAEAKVMAVGGDKVVALCQVANTLSLIEEFDRAAGTLRTALDMARLAGWQHVYKALENGAHILAAVDQGSTLWQIHEAVQEINDWWKETSLT